MVKNALVYQYMILSLRSKINGSNTYFQSEGVDGVDGVVGRRDMNHGRRPMMKQASRAAVVSDLYDPWMKV
jgi:hypothetical protein